MVDESFVDYAKLATRSSFVDEFVVLGFHLIEQRLEKDVLLLIQIRVKSCMVALLGDSNLHGRRHPASSDTSSHVFHIVPEHDGASHILSVSRIYCIICLRYELGG